MSLVADQSLLKEIFAEKSPIDKAMVGTLGAKAVASKEERFFTFCARKDQKDLDFDTQLENYQKFSKVMAESVKEEGKIF